MMVDMVPTGILPTEIGLLAHLEKLSLSHNGLEGEFRVAF